MKVRTLKARQVLSHLDTAHAYAQWGKSREAHTALIKAYARRKPFHGSVATLQEEGVTVLVGEGGPIPHPADQGTDTFGRSPRTAASESVDQRTGELGGGPR